MTPGPRRRLADALLVGVAAVALAASVPSPSRAQQPSRTDTFTHHGAAAVDSLSRVSSGDSGSAAQRSLVIAAGEVRLECVGCHRGVHGVLPDSATSWSPACRTCHGAAHSAVVALYSGSGAPIAIPADTMFRARVDCRGCHTASALAAGAPRPETMDRVCTECHGPAFAGMATRWVRGLDWRTGAVRDYLRAANGNPRLGGRARSLTRSADSTLARVVRGDGVHNIPGADALLRGALARVDSAYRIARVAAPARPSLGPDPSSSSCAHCHYGIETIDAGPSGFSHTDHVVRADVACSSCHSTGGFFIAGSGRRDPRHGATTVGAPQCSDCHHVTSRLQCTTCHATRDLAARSESVALALRLTPPGAPTSRLVGFRHADHPGVECTRCHASRSAIRAVAACADCHESHHREAGDCAACHGTTLLAEHTRDAHLTCTRCHARATVALLTPDRSFCLSCHVDQADHERARECSTCHMQMSPAELRARILEGR